MLEGADELDRQQSVFHVYLMLLPAFLIALDPTLAISQYAKKHWQVEQGLRRIT
jgi:hypothetical protein